ncbi:MAG: hypothetical protein HFE39_04930 [Clostridiales bacterium]|jgi:hypothetical protein|nr:hypothetical protein [Clostridiales bacterium]
MDGFYSGSPLGLNMLIASDTANHDFFSDLPKEIQWQLEEHQDEFHSLADAKEFAQNLMNQ